MALLVLAAAQMALTPLPWITFGGVSLSGLETSSIGLGPDIKDGHVVMAIAAATILAVFALARGNIWPPIAMITILGASTVVVTGEVATSEWRFIPSNSSFLITLWGKPTWLLHTAIALGGVQALIGSLLAIGAIQATQTASEQLESLDDVVETHHTG